MKKQIIILMGVLSLVVLLNFTSAFDVINLVTPDSEDNTFINTTFVTVEGNLSWNQTLAALLFGDIQWGFNQTDTIYWYNMTDTHLFYNFTDTVLFYNMTVLDTDTVDGNASSICAGNDTYLSGESSCNNLTLLYADIQWGFNQTDTILNYNMTDTHFFYNFTDTVLFYNMSDGAGTGNLSWNQTLAALLFGDIQWGFNQTDTILNYNMTVLDTDTNFSACGDGEYGDGTGECINFNDTVKSLFSELQVEYNATEIEVITGTLDGGNIASVLILGDGDTYNVSEVSGTPGFLINVTFTNVTNFNTVAIRGKYDGGSGHTIDLELFRLSTQTWDDFGDITDQPDFGVTSFPVFVGSDFINTTIGNGTVLFRLNHDDSGITAHDYFLDAIFIGQVTGLVSGGAHDDTIGRGSLTNHPWAMDTGATRNFTSNLYGDVGINSTFNWFFGLFDWFVDSTSTNWLEFNGSTASYNETHLNKTISLEGVSLGFNSTFNATYLEYAFNQTDTILNYNMTDTHLFYNMTDTVLFYNMTDTHFFYNFTDTILNYNMTDTHLFYNMSDGDSNLTEDDVEAYIFDDDNAIDINFSLHNGTSIDCLHFLSGGAICSGS